LIQVQAIPSDYSCQLRVTCSRDRHISAAAYAHAGISLPRAAADQSRTGISIPLDRIQPGDLIFESGSDGTPTNPGHVALALGNGYLLEAPHTGAVVRIASTFLRDVVAVRRVVPDGPSAEPAPPLRARRRPSSSNEASTLPPLSDHAA
jgi:hypothetical protein